MPSPSHLHVRVKNTTAIPYRAAYLHGPYTLHVSSYPSSFDPYKKLENPRREGYPEFEPNLKAGGNWHSRLTIPQDIRESGERPGNAEDNGQLDKVTWVIEIASQVLFSATASVHYELLVGRDQRSLDVGFAAIASKGHGEPGKITDLIQYQLDEPGQNIAPKGVYSGAIKLLVEDTTALWNKPALPSQDDGQGRPSNAQGDEKSRKSYEEEERQNKPKKPRKIHLVILTHGLHSNIGADMLYMKESIDATVRDSREEARKRRAEMRHRERVARSQREDIDSQEDKPDASAESIPAANSIDDEDDNDDDEDDDEEVLVRGFPGNAVRTERGIQYLGKRLAKFVLTFTYPDQPSLPVGRSITKTLTDNLTSTNSKPPQQTTASHAGSSVQKLAKKKELPYTFTSISFIGHSLGGLIQTYAIAYIQKHSPEFFQKIQPVNFVTMAAPLLGLSNENPLYVRFALDFGLVGRTGQDLGLTWRAPTIARNGWSAMIAGFGGSNAEQEPRHEDPRSKPLLRILPSGPAHQVLKMFRNRTLYSNVVNDGIVPLRTSCLLFLDWRGLGPVENARRENGLIGTMAQFGWAELTGANTVSHRPQSIRSSDNNISEGSDVEANELKLSTSAAQSRLLARTKSNTSEPSPSDQSPSPQQFIVQSPRSLEGEESRPSGKGDRDISPSRNYNNGAFNDFLNFFRPKSPRSTSPKPSKTMNKAERAYRRAQTVHKEAGPSSAFSIASGASTSKSAQEQRPSVTRGDSVLMDPSSMPPPKTSIFEAARDIINPPIPTQSWLTDPSSRTRTIFHDRVYHPEDIPPPPQRRSILSRSISSDSIRSSSKSMQRQDSQNDGTGMKVEEKIARAYHRDLSWRKVLVRLEPDAHNNMIVRRIFANAYGWEVIRHLCDTHFGSSYTAVTSDENETSEDRAKAPNEPVGDRGEEVDNQTAQTSSKETRQARTTSELREAADELKDLNISRVGSAGLSSKSSSLRRSSVEPTRRSSKQDSVLWNDDLFNENSDDDETDPEDTAKGPFETFQKFWASNPRQSRRHSDLDGHRLPGMGLETRDQSEDAVQGTSEEEINEFLSKSGPSPSTDAQRVTEPKPVYTPRGRS